MQTNNFFFPEKEMLACGLKGFKSISHCHSSESCLFYLGPSVTVPAIIGELCCSLFTDILRVTCALMVRGDQDFIP